MSVWLLLLFVNDDDKEGWMGGTQQMMLCNQVALPVGICEIEGEVIKQEWWGAAVGPRLRPLGNAPLASSVWFCCDARGRFTQLVYSASMEIMI